MREWHALKSQRAILFKNRPAVAQRNRLVFAAALRTGFGPDPNGLFKAQNAHPKSGRAKLLRSLARRRARPRSVVGQRVLQFLQSGRVSNRLDGYRFHGQDPFILSRPFSGFCLWQGAFAQKIERNAKDLNHPTRSEIRILMRQVSGCIGHLHTRFDIAAKRPSQV